MTSAGWWNWQGAGATRYLAGFGLLDAIVALRSRLNRERRAGRPARGAALDPFPRTGFATCLTAETGFFSAARLRREVRPR